MQTFEVELVFLDGYKIEVVVYADDDEDASAIAVAYAQRPLDSVESIVVTH